MRHPAGVFDQRLNSAERLTEENDLGSADDIQRRLLAAANPEADHAAVPAHLLLGQIMTGMGIQARKVHLGHPRVLPKPVSKALSVVAVAFHPDSEGAQAAQHQPAVERAGHAAYRVLMEAETL